MVSFFGIIAFVAASYGLYAQIHKKEIAQAVAAYIVTVLTIIIAVVSFQNSPNTTLVEQEDIAKESAKPTSTSTIQPVDSEDDGESEKKLNTKETNETETMSFTGNKISGIMDGEDSREEQYMATQTGIYRFDFDIDDVNKGYCFYILDSKQEEVQRGYSSDSGINAYMESGMEYTLVVEHSEQEEEVEYCISIHSPDGIENIEGKSIKGEISYIGQEKEYIYSAQRSGIYRFDFDIDDVNNDYVFQVYDSKNNELLYKKFSDKGGTIELTKGEIYKVKVVQNEGMPKYTIKIGVPNKIKDVQEDKITGEIKYNDQTDTFNYTTPRTGVYRFDFEIDDVNNEYDFKIFDEKREEIVNTYSSNEGKTVELQKGKKYEIQIGQNTGFAKYAIQIHIPNKVYTINNNVISGSISYIDQQNVYYYTPKRTGTYGFSFGINNAENSYRISLFDSKNEVIFDTYSSNECKEVELKKNQKYRLHVNYSRGFEKYKISIKQI